MAESYLVRGLTEAPDCHSEWIVAAFTSEGDASRLVAALNAELKRRGMLPGNERLSLDDRWRAKEEMRVFDPQCEIDYTGAQYSLLTVPLNPPTTDVHAQPETEQRTSGE